jgi:hypothetical protein
LLEAGFIGELRAGFDQLVQSDAGTRHDECYAV